LLAHVILLSLFLNNFKVSLKEFQKLFSNIDSEHLNLILLKIGCTIKKGFITLEAPLLIDQKFIKNNEISNYIEKRIIKNKEYFENSNNSDNTDDDDDDDNKIEKKFEKEKKFLKEKEKENHDENDENDENENDDD
jgi:hypothetical protein